MDFLTYVRGVGEEVPVPEAQRMALARGFLVGAVNAERPRARKAPRLGSRVQPGRTGR